MTTEQKNSIQCQIKKFEEIKAEMMKRESSHRSEIRKTEKLLTTLRQLAAS